MFVVSASTPDYEEKTVYKRVLRGGEIPSNGLQKFPSINRGKLIHLEVFPSISSAKRNSLLESNYDKCFVRRRIFPLSSIILTFVNVYSEEGEKKGREQIITFQ